MSKLPSPIDLRAVSMNSAELAKLKERKPKGTTWINDGTLLPVDLYCYLKARFGNPNGYLMLVRHPSSDNIIQWHFTLEAGDVRVQVFGLNSHLELMIGGPAGFSEQQVRDFAISLRDDFRNYKVEMADIRKKLERWILFVNPFARVEAVVAKLRDDLENLKFEIPSRPPTLVTKKVMEEYGDKMKEALPRHAEAQILGTCLRMLVPVMAEAFINLVIFCLAKPDVRDDDRLYERYIRNEIDVRLTGMHLHCNGFSGPVDRDASEVKGLLSLMNRRNDLLHGNVDPQRLKFDEVFFDGTIPLFKDDRSLSARFLENSLKYIEPDAAMEDVKTVAQFIAYLLARLKPESRKVIELVMYEREPGWRPDRNRIGVLFPPHIAEFYVGRDESEDSRSGE